MISERWRGTKNSAFHHRNTFKLKTYSNIKVILNYIKNFTILQFSQFF